MARLLALLSLHVSLCATSSIAKDSRLMRSVAVGPDGDQVIPLPLCNGTSVDTCDEGMPDPLCSARYACDSESCSFCGRVDDKCVKEKKCKR
mmetsp:Transcript_119330/g.283276  ORF Transcript_119330/g.283276 Transcript_119330/m.283276 type:complete len:92 (+) Transcript_119330:36-311(+)|eukprot:CAMPEP_0181464616 /NCGR_PEP_ID=MMETSP1110-20121109/35525_1 /TAXON_ID=174948 /ORGANISM="Symbiodinium sp., Strain CCMP421" /LENGTH=91 /DNA_ID=CAMNT_0023589357 /DNA_START=36 /DNA_END=311 /DNA_ORIENTATION=-